MAISLLDTDKKLIELDSILPEAKIVTLENIINNQTINSISISSSRTKKIEGLPSPRLNTIYLVNQDVLSMASGRVDVFSPDYVDGAVYEKNNKLVYITKLIAAG